MVVPADFASTRLKKNRLITFYPGLQSYLLVLLGVKPKALIVPHAGYIYSGAIAASAYAQLTKYKDKISRVILLGPCHRVWIRGLALPSSDYFGTPLGNVKLDSTAIASVSRLPQVSISDEAHSDEHSLEVQLPFLQTILNDFTLVPIVVGDASSQEVAEVIKALWGGEETLVVISSDLSHFLDYETALTIDAKTTHAIEQLQGELISQQMACGSIGIKGIIEIAKEKQLAVKTIAQCNSGDTAGDKSRVVGYASYAFY